MAHENNVKLPKFCSNVLTFNLIHVMSNCRWWVPKCSHSRHPVLRLASRERTSQTGFEAKLVLHSDDGNQPHTHLCIHIYVKLNSFAIKQIRSKIWAGKCHVHVYEEEEVQQLWSKTHLQYYTPTIIGAAVVDLATTKGDKKQMDLFHFSFFLSLCLFIPLALIWADQMRRGKIGESSSIFG